MKPYQIFEHTADVGLRISGRTFKELLLHAAAGLFDLITDAKTIKPLKNEEASGVKNIQMRLKAENPEELFLKWLREWLFLFSTKKRIPVQYHFTKLTKKELAASVKCALFNPRLHEQRCEVKAVTYHGFKLRRGPKAWSAEIIVDI